MEEIWKDIKDYEGLYQVSNLGKIRSYPNLSHKDFFILKQWITQGYYYVKLFKDGKRKSYSVHRLVAEAFIPNPDNLPQVGHKDENNFKTGDECNNCVDNLEWCTAKENANMPKRKDKTFGENNPFYGLHHTEETRKQMSEKRKGENHPMYGKHLPKETRNKISQKHKGKHLSLETKKKKSKPVKCIETGIIYYSAVEAAKQTGLGASHIRECCRGEAITCGDYHWEYVKEKK